MAAASSSNARRVVVVGGGVTGLTVAYTLLRGGADVEVTVLEAAERTGGNIRTERRDGCVLDTGPDSFLVTKPDALALCRELGLGADLVATREEARRVYFAHGGRLELMPAGMTLAVPTRIRPMITTPLLSPRGKLRALVEPLMPRRPGDADESIEAFFARRFGREAAVRLAAPLLGGVYAGDTAALSMRATFPQLVDMEAKHGSLVRGFFAAAAQSSGSGSLLGWLFRDAEATAASPFRSLQGGLGRLIEALEAVLPGGVVHKGRRASRVVRGGIDGARFSVETPSGTLAADAVVLGVPAHAAAALVPDAELSRDLAEVPYVSTATVFLAFDRPKVAHALDALGFVAPSGESELLAGTFISSKWADRAPASTALLRVFIGGSRSSDLAESASDATLMEIALRELRRLMGRLEQPRWTQVYRYLRASPQPIVGHVDRMNRVRARLEGIPGLYLAGAGYDGVGIPDCVRQARAVAARILH